MELNWISVNDFLPTSNDKEVLVSNHRYETVASYWNRVGAWITPWGDSVHDVTHWAVIQRPHETSQLVR